MMKFPNKVVSVPKSVIGNMLLIMEQIEGSELSIKLLLIKLKSKMGMVEMIDALTCLYAIGRIEIKNHQIVVL